MVCRLPTFVFVAVTAFSAIPAVHSLTDYANDFLNPGAIFSNNYTNTALAQSTILSWADLTAAGGPWTVTKKPFAAPSGDIHDYMSWAPYWWPDCSNVHNTTALTDQQVWQQCNYVQKDGQLNPSNRLINNIGDFESLADAVLYNSLAWVLQKSGTYSGRVADYVNTWFLKADTKMNPNLNYAQMQGGPNGQVGSHTGILDLKCMAKIASGVLLLRQGKAPEWTSDIDTAFNEWIKSYIQWLTTADIAIQERKSANNHGSFYYNQLAALQVLAGDNNGAQQTIEEYFSTIYLGQINANGDQPLESERTRPYHYRAYNLAAMITNAKIGEYVGVNAWNKTTSQGATIQSALDFAMTIPATGPDASYVAELYPNIAAVASKYGDPDNKYASFLAKAEGDAYVKDANFFWNQPLSDSGFAKEGSTSTMKAPAATGSSGKGASSTSQAPHEKSTVGTKQENAAFSLGLSSWRAWGMLYGVCMLVMAASFVEFL